MKRILFGILFLVITIFVIKLGNSETSKNDLNDCLATEAANIDTTAKYSSNTVVVSNRSPNSLSTSEPEENTNLPKPEKHKIKLLMTGDYHGQDVDTKTGV